MEKTGSFKEKLLERGDAETSLGQNSQRELSRSVIAAHAARLRRMKTLAAVSWILFAASCLASGIWGALTGFHSKAWIIATIIGVQALLIIAAALTVSFSLKSRSLRMKEIQAALADIQDQIKALAAEKSL